MSIDELHGAVLTARKPNSEEGEREVLVGFECADWPDCETCGHLDEEHIVSDEELDSDDPMASQERWI